MNIKQAHSTSEIKHTEENHYTNGIILGKSPVMRKLLEMIRRISTTDHPVLITGPTGSGKEITAALIHRFSGQKNELFIDINCGAIPEQLVESHLFGHERGAFTGAMKKHDGFFSTVGNGIIFLDEIGELSPFQQVKLLRVLETRSFRPVGSNENINFHGRIITATHRNLEKMVADGTFREDLYYRLNVFNLKIPPLDQRRDDIPEFIELFRSQQKRPVKFSSGAISALCGAEWPGNIRQLKNTIDKITVLCDETPISSESVQDYVSGRIDTSDSELESISRSIMKLNIENKLSAIEHSLIQRAIEESNGNKSKAAKLLGVHRKYVERHIKAFNGNINAVSELIIEGNSTKQS